MIGIDDDLLAVSTLFRSLEFALFEALVVDGQIVAFPFEQFDGIATAVQENKNTAIRHIGAKMFFHQAQRPSNPLRKSAGPLIQKYLVEASRCSTLYPLQVDESGRWTAWCKEKESIPLGLVTMMRSTMVSSGTCTETGMKQAGAGSQSICFLNRFNQ